MFKRVKTYDLSSNIKYLGYRDFGQIFEKGFQKNKIIDFFTEI